jgi:uridine kinase
MPARAPGETVRAIVQWMTRQPVRRTLLVGIDGGGGAGKSTLAATVAEVAVGVVNRSVSIVHLDDFYLPSRQRPPIELHGIDVDLARLRRQVIDPLRAGRIARYQRYDWPTDALAEWYEVSPLQTVILEGVGAAAESLRDGLDLIVWIDCPADVRLRRGLARDGEQARAVWSAKWLPTEEQYVASQHPDEAAHFRVNGLLPYDSRS